ncbi:MAG: malQ [Verrucomicrobiaceae bacterium]|nr:malQ [Verrucomicrobiaceae bacterium]
MLGIPRSSGILLHPSSLPGRFGIGEIGPEAHRWLDWLATTKQRLWQMLPLGPTGYGNSPYQSLSSFAGNPLLISFEALRNDGVLLPGDLAMLPSFSDDRVEFGPAIEVRMAFLKLAARRFVTQTETSPLVGHAFEAFCEREASWLDDWAMFAALKQENNMSCWTDWPRDIALREQPAMNDAMVRLSEEIAEQKAMQFLFFRQWHRLHGRAQELGIHLIGDIPIFAAHDSADVWASPHLFHLDENGNPTVVAGVPPDYFSATGQRWGNPLYNWEAHRAEGFAWWKARLRASLQMVDVVRIDHFRAFAAYWEIPADEPTAVNGKWVDSPGAELFEALKAEFGGNVPIIAEDLGIITPDVTELRESQGFPGMRVMQFAFGGDTLAEEYVPENYPEDSVAYTGTHDNDTTMGLFYSVENEESTRTAEQIEAERKCILKYTGTDGSQLNWDFIEHVWASKADFAICPMQDILGTDSSTRMNVPGKSGEFWTWRFKWEAVAPDLAQRLRKVTEATGR